MPALLTFFTSAFTSVFAFLAARMGARAAVITALIAAYVTAASAFALTINGLIGGVLYTMPTFVSDMFAMLPTNTDECISVCLAAEAAAYLYRQIVIVASLKARVI